MAIGVVTFTVAAVLIVLLPGPDTLVVVRNLVRGGRAAGVRTVAGVLCGLAVWVVTAALGLSAVLRASADGYTALRLAGAVYLIWLGLQSLRSRPGERPAELSATRAGPLGSGYRAGLATDLLNPKVGVFFVSFLPGFVPPGYPVGPTALLFGGIFIVLTGLYFAVLLRLAGSVTRWMTQPSVRRRLDRLTGLVLIGFGVRLATDG